MRLLPIRLTVEALAADESGVVPWTPEICDQIPRVTLTVVELVGSPLIWTRSTLPVAESTTSSTSWFIRNVASARVSVVCVPDEIAAPSEVDRARYLWVYIMKSTRSTGT